jgi:hypothetical protein
MTKTPFHYRKYFHPFLIAEIIFGNPVKKTGKFLPRYLGSLKMHLNSLYCFRNHNRTPVFFAV